MSEVSRYFDTDLVESAVQDGMHRFAVGGMWDEIGALQLSFLKEQGLRPSGTFLDVGCGCLRGGVHFIEYLDEGNYFGMDINQSLLDAGYDVELKRLGLQAKMPRKNLICSDNFDVEQFGRRFDFVLALSLFTHLTLNHIRVCLEKLAPCMSGRGQFFATYNEIPASHPSHEPFLRWPRKKITHATREPYHYKFDDFVSLVPNRDWIVEKAMNFEHPREQSVLKFSPVASKAS
ncbi:MAG TPA: class I SAM-dependent methyltransferase [Solirubrobacterales bacterium]|nr:class I SAM-dependent methyltransferase [Solirubrobacterales bacterium]